MFFYININNNGINIFFVYLLIINYKQMNLMIELMDFL